jgi:phospholipase C
MPNNLNMYGIQKVVVLMLENRGFDHVMGWLYGADEKPVLIPGNSCPTFQGLSTLSAQQLAALANTSPFPGQLAMPPRRGARSPKTPAYNPGEHFLHIMPQMWDPALYLPGQTINWADEASRTAAINAIILARGGNPLPPMTGYMVDYANELEELKATSIDSNVVSEIMDTYVPEQLPVLSGLARAYAVSDSWFCSVPSQTNTNRAFSTAGTARGLVNNNFYDALSESWNPFTNLFSYFAKGSHADRLPAGTRSLFNLLEDLGVDGRVFGKTPWPPRAATTYQHQYVRTMFSDLDSQYFNKNFVQFDPNEADNPFFKSIREGTLPDVSWVEPAWNGGPSWKYNPRVPYQQRSIGNDMHPVADTTLAEDFVRKVYLALSADNALWNQTLLVITFDENGGTYDHAPPPPALPTFRDRVPMPYDQRTIEGASRTQFGFGFDQFGVRVPTIFISPFIQPGTLIRSPTGVPFDHTSLIATILDWKGVPPEEWFLGQRVANAPSFDGVLSLPLNGARPADDPVVGIQAALRVPAARASNSPLMYGEDLILKYIGDRWVAPTPPRYLSHARYGYTTYYYPTLGADRGGASTLRIFGGGASLMRGDPIANLSTILIASLDPTLNDGNVIAASNAGKTLFYTGTGDGPGLRWQIRLFSSRTAEDPICDGDEICLFSLLPRGTGQDPIQRMAPWPDDQTYLTSRAGDWSIWQVIRPRGPLDT